MKYFNEVISSNNLGIYQNNLVSANQDYLALDVEEMLSLGEYIEINIYVDYSGGNVTFASSSGTQDYIGVLSNGNLYVQLSSTFSGSTVNIPIGFNTIKFRRALDGSNYISANGGSEQILGSLPNAPMGLKYIGRRTTAYASCKIKDFYVNGETFSLNEANGATFYGSGGATGTRNTSHADGLEYISNVMIERYG